MLISTFHRGRILGRAGPSGGSATHLGITTQPSSTATSGAAFSQQPVIALLDAVGSPVSQSGVVVSAAIATGTGTLGGTTTATTNSSGVATFTNLLITGASTDTIGFSATSLTGATSESIVVSTSTFASPDVVWADWSGTSLSNGGLISGRNFTTDAPGHVFQTTNPTGTKPWSSSSNNVIEIDFDIALGSDINLFFYADPSAWATISYGDAFYVSGWLYVGTDADLSTDLRKYIYSRMNAGLASNTDIVFRSNNFGSGTVWQGETDTSANSANWTHDGEGTLTKGAWHYVEVENVLDSSPGAHDGTVTLWVDNATTPLIGPVTIQNSESGYPSGSSWKLDLVMIGHQLENGSQSETRYWGPCAVSTSRIGPL